MIWETSLLHYPDYCGKDIPYDEYILDDEKGKIGFYFEVLLSDGTHVKLPNTGIELNITIPSNSSLYIEKFAFHCSKDFDPGEIRFQPYFQRRSTIPGIYYDKKPINNNYFVDKEYLNDLIFTKETKSTLLVEGERVTPNKQKRKKAKAETVYTLISGDDEDHQLIGNSGSEPRYYVLGIRVTNHWDVSFEGKYHNKLFMQNDDCDGMIWEKKHTPNDYVLVFAEWYASYYWHDKAMIMYPNDRYAIPTGMTGAGSTNRGAITRDFFVRGYWYLFYDIGGQWYTTKDGHDWVHCKEVLRPDNSYGNWTPNENRGIFTRQGNIYLAEIEDNGQIHFTNIGPFGERTWVGDGIGYIYFTLNRDHSEFKTIYSMDSSGSVHATCLKTSEYTISRVTAWNSLGIVEGGYVNPDLRNHRFIGISKDGFSSMSTYSTLNGGIPKYGTNFAWHIWGESIYWTVRRQDPKTGEWYTDVGPLGSDMPSASYLDGTLDVSMELAGMSSADASKAHYRDLIVDGKYLKGAVYVPDTPSMNSVMYFRDGKPSYAFGHQIRFWEAWNNVVYCLVIGRCDRHSVESHPSDIPPWGNIDGSFAFDLTSNYMIDPDNETWIYPYG